MNLEQLTAGERLMAEQAVLGYREVSRAMRVAPHGRGLAVIEQAAVQQMRRQGAAMVEQALVEAAAAEEKGGEPAAAGGRRRIGGRSG